MLLVCKNGTIIVLYCIYNTKHKVWRSYSKTVLYSRLDKDIAKDQVKSTIHCTGKMRLLHWDYMVAFDAHTLVLVSVFRTLNILLF